MRQGLAVQPGQHVAAGPSAVRRPAEVPRHLGPDVVRSVCRDVAGQVQLLPFGHGHVPAHRRSQDLKIKNKHT